jgi:hypothetical protein
MLDTVYNIGDYFYFGSVFIKKNNQIEIIFLKKTETDSNRPVSVWFFRTKPVQTSFARFFQFGLVFCRFGSVFFGLGSVRFGFFSFRLIKLKPN